MIFFDHELLDGGEFFEALAIDEALEYAPDFENLPIRWLQKYGDLFFVELKSEEGRRLLSSFKQVYADMVKRKRDFEAKINDKNRG